MGDDRIAVVGMACRFAGDATSPTRLWEMLQSSQTAWGGVPKSRFNVAAFQHPNRERGDATNVSSGHFLKQDVAHFDKNFFGLSTEVAKSMDPQQRMTLEVVYEAAESAGITLDQLAGSNTSVFAGLMQRDYHDGLLRDPDRLPSTFNATNAAAMASNRVSHFYDLRGPSMTVDTACSTTLTAVHLACASLRSGESDASIVTGTNLMLNPEFFVTMSNVGFLSPDGKSYAFDERANGYGRGEGIAAIMLKPLADAIAANDPIQAVICATALNQDGKTATITRPSSEAQQALIENCYRRANLDMKDTGYVEAHGTGTPTGDPLELKAIANTIGAARSSASLPLWLGSIKSHIGHCEAASGLASIIKVALSLKAGIIPRTAEFADMSRACSNVAGHAMVPRESVKWPEQDCIRRASINNFGFGGANAHVIMEEPPDLGDDQTTLSSPPRRQVFVLSGFDDDALRRTAVQLSRYLAQHQSKHGRHLDLLLHDLAYTLHQRRSRFSCIDAVSAVTVTELIQSLEQVGGSPSTTSKTALRIGFVFNGQGASWQGMGKELFATYPVFRASIQNMAGYMREMGTHWCLEEELMRDPKSSLLDETEYSLPLSIAVQVALTDLLRSWNVNPTVVTGHSSGEVAAAYAARAIDARSAIALGFIRGALSPKNETNVRRGAMLAVGLSEEETLFYITAVDRENVGQVWVACVNSHRSVTASGDADAIALLQSLLDNDGVFCRRLRVQTAFHTEHMAPISSEFVAQVRPWLVALPTVMDGADKDTPPIAFYSSVTGQKLPELKELATPEYWDTNMLSQVKFDRALRSMCFDREQHSNLDFLVEIGPHSALKGPVMDGLKQAKLQGAEGDIGYGSCLIRNEDSVQSIQGLICELIRRGHEGIDLDAVNTPFPSRSPRPLTDLPSYPWSHETPFWIEESRNKSYRHRREAPRDLLGVRDDSAEPATKIWRNSLKLSDVPWLRDHVVDGKVVFPAAGYVCMAIDAISQATMQRGDDGEFHIRDVSFSRGLIVPDDDGDCQIQLHLQACPTKDLKSSGWFEFQIQSCESKPDGIDVWRVHCSGQIRTNDRDDGQPVIRRRGSIPSGESLMEPEDLWLMLQRVGIQYGPSFRGIHGIAQQDCTSAGETNVALRINDTAATMPAGHESEYVMHPTTLDATLQAAYAALSTICPANIKQAYLPYSIASMRLWSGTPRDVGHQLSAVVSSGRLERNAFCVDVAVYDDPCSPDTRPVLELSGLEFHSLATLDSNDADATDKKNGTQLLTQVSWKPDVQFGIPESILSGLKHLTDPGEKQTAKALRSVALHYMSKALEVVPPHGVCGQLPHLTKYRQWMADELQLTPPPTLIPGEFEGMLRQVASSGVEGEMTVRLGPNIPAILQGHISALDLMMQDRLLYRYYENGPRWQRSTAQLASLLRMMAEVNPECRILEVGAGTGTATKAALDSLSLGSSDSPQEAGSPDETLLFGTYDFTDISPGFFASAKQHFGPRAERMTFKTLDIGRDPSDQGFEAGTYDVVIACQVLHATADMNQTMTNVRRLLKPGGKLLLMETTRDPLDLFLAFGLLPGWWLSTEPQRAASPSLSVELWDLVLRESGFSGIDHHLRDCEEQDNYHFSVIMSTARCESGAPLNGTHINPLRIVVRDLASVPQAWIGDLEHALTSALGVPPTCCDLDSSREWKDAPSVIYIEAPGTTLLHCPSNAYYDKLQELLTTCQRVLWITHGAAMDVVDPHASLIQGIFRSLRCEYSANTYITCDLDPHRPMWTSDSAHTIAQVYSSTCVTLGEGHEGLVRDFEFCERQGVIHVPRFDPLVYGIPGPIATAPATTQAFTEDEHPCRFDVRVPGLLVTLEFTPDESRERISLPPDMVEIEPRAFGLNSRHVSFAMGDLPCEHLPALECSGIVVRLGATAALQGLHIGDRVCAITADGWRSKIWTPWTNVAKIPDFMNWEAAASIPVAFTTAYIALIKMARVKSGQTVLIHAAAGGLGQAAVSTCQYLGAVVYVTVGTERKRQAITERFGIPPEHIFNSRKPDFAHGVLQATNGRGVDVVLNSLTGPLLQSGLDCLARFGTFVELGRRDIENHHRIDLTPFSRGISVSALDLALMAEHRPHEIKEGLDFCVRLVSEKILPGILPVLVFPMASAEQGFRQLQTGQHIGKIVLSVEEANGMIPIRRPLLPVRLSPDASYLVVGGTGGIGKKVCEWLLQRGAVSLIVLSRNPVKDAQFWAPFLQEKCNIRTIACDVSNKRELKAAIATCTDLPPIRGVVHSGMVLRDSAFENMSKEDYMAAILPKVAGTWNLHELFPVVDFFIMLSSVLGVLGSPGQVSYTAGCAFQDSIARSRRSRGMNGVSIDLASVESVGYVAEHNASDRLKKRGVLPQTVDTVLHLLEIAILQEPKAFHQITSGIDASPGAHWEGDVLSFDKRFSIIQRHGLSLSTQSDPEGLRRSMLTTAQKTSSTLSTRIDASMTRDHATQVVLEEISVKLEEMFGKSRIDHSRDFSASGVDSLVAIELRNWLGRQTGLAVTVMDLMQASSIHDFASEMAVRLGCAFSSPDSA